MTNSEKLREAINMIKSGHKFEARVTLSEIIKQQPDWIDPWMWMAQALETDEDRLTLMEHCSRYIPDDENVKRAIKALGEKIKQEKPKKKKRRKAAGASPNWSMILRYSGIAAIFLVIILIVAFVGSRLTGPDGVIAMFPSPTSTATTTLTPTLTPTVTLTPTPTATLTPTNTPTITPTPEPPEIMGTNLELLQHRVILEGDILTFSLDSADKNLAYAECIDEVIDPVCQNVELHVMDLDTAFNLYSYSDDLVHVFDLAFSPDDSSVISGGCSLYDSSFLCHSGRMLQWNLNSVSLSWDTEVGIREIRKLVLSPNENKVISGGFAGAHLWDLETGINTDHLAAEFFYNFGVAYSPDGALVAISGNSIIILYNMETLERIETFEGHTDSVTLAVFNTDGSRLVSFGDEQLIFWNPETGQSVATINFDEQINDMLFMPGENILVLVTEEGLLIFLDAESKEIVHTLSNPDYSYRKIVLSSDGRKIIALSTNNDMSAELILWEVPNP